MKSLRDLMKAALPLGFLDHDRSSQLDGAKRHTPPDSWLLLFGERIFSIDSRRYWEGFLKRCLMN
jgi:hypothetical protein